VEEAKPSRRERTGMRGARCAGLPLLGLLGACRATGTEPEHAFSAPPGVPRVGELPVAEAISPPFQGLGAALEDGDDALARVMLARLEPLASTEGERAFLASCGRILAGRELLGSIRIELVLEAPDGGERHEGRLFLAFLQTTEAPLTLHLPPADLGHVRTWIEERGIESRVLSIATIAGLERLLLPPGVARRIEIGTVRTEVPRALAVRDGWEVIFRSGEIERQGERLPVRSPPSPRLEHTTLGAGIEATPAEPGELARAFADPASELVQVLVLAVRIPAEERNAALAALAPEVERLVREDPERLRTLAPALRWIARSPDPGADPTRWAAWFRAFAAREERARAEAERDERLDLPRVPRR